MWRPDNWAEIKRKLCDTTLKDVGGAHCETCPADPQTCGVPHEEAVDAFLQAIRERGFISGAAIKRLGPGVQGMDSKGKWYSIPDDE